MTARQVHAVVAAGLDNPTLVARWTDDPAQLAGHGVDPQSIDLAALRKFAGMAAKVRHNPLRDLFPLAFRLMNVGGLEIEVFAAYAAHRASLGYATTMHERARDLIAFLEQWLDRENATHALLWDIIRHEHALVRLENAIAFAPTSSKAPQLAGQTILHEMQCDPRDAATILRQSKPRLDDIDRAPRFFCYQRTDGIRMIELDDLGYFVLSLVDGRRTITAISRALGLGNPTRTFRTLLGQLADAGILRLA